MSVECFNIERCLEKFNASLKDEDDVLLDEYLQGFEEINSFFHLMGTVFGFVSSDVRAKIDILADFRKKENSEQFTSIKQMIEYEKSGGLLNDTSYVSGSRTLLRLHRGLEFVHEFLLRVGDLGECDKTSGCCKSAYNDTLSKHHSWLIRRGALVAMYAMPTKGELLKRVGVSQSRATEILPDMLKATKIVHNRTESLYTLFELHELP
ncbi:ceramide-1-phosphate transfer protein [Episyrphus balteatus]|uniref:ceramide-1-phosphate transfer protein n=1 Tax=Episyrphus balteatus TaxID=286459 RepID=UPI0024859CCA|nr:ceramide-1-phosphate transfer protein [Episyrphus balteatus]